MCTRLTETGFEWTDGSRAEADAVIWCTGFRPALSHLIPLGLRQARGHIPTENSRAVEEPRLRLLGYGDWTGPASAALMGVDRPAREGARDAGKLPGINQYTVS
jgi:putative flavoprotein involved in K+ transport